MAEVETAIDKLQRAGIQNIDNLPVGAVKALASLPEAELRALVHAQETVKSRVKAMDGNIIF